MFTEIALCLIAMSLWWWWRVDFRLRSLPRARVWRVLLAAFAVGVIVLPLLGNHFGHRIPAPLPAMGFIWHVLVLPWAFLSIVIIDAFSRRRRRQRQNPPSPTDVSRRNFLTVAAAVVPPLATAGLVAAGLEQIGKFNVREWDVFVTGWPAELNGFTIAFVADVHTGPFSTPAMLADIVRRTNAIHRGGPADLVVFGGDLINTTLRDLPAGLDMLNQLRGRLGIVACIGNHDVMDDGEEFTRRVRAAGIPLLRNSQCVIEAAPGLPIQILGVDWEVGDAAIFRSVRATAALRDPSLFPICLAHHPHAWDEAVRQGLPLVLSGHTHGGQIMLTDTIGAGPLKFRYWTGMHQRDNSTLVISNGVGNWFPLRVNAPAELLKLTLFHSAATNAAAPAIST